MMQQDIFFNLGEEGCSASKLIKTGLLKKWWDFLNLFKFARNKLIYILSIKIGFWKRRERNRLFLSRLKSGFSSKRSKIYIFLIYREPLWFYVRAYPTSDQIAALQYYQNHSKIWNDLTIL